MNKMQDNWTRLSIKHLLMRMGALGDLYNQEVCSVVMAIEPAQFVHALPKFP
jgi:hypothetical protein